MKSNNADPTAQSNDLAVIDNLEITPLSDRELDSVAGGGTTDYTTAASCYCCAAGATHVVLIPV